MRLIDADTLKKTICTNVYPVADDFNSRDYGMFWTGGIEKAIDNAPTIDAVPVRRGKWLDEGQYADFFPHHAWRCSECGEHVIEIDTPWYKYCPNCGARMDEE